MDKTVKIYDLKDPQQYEDEREYWRNKSPEEKLKVLEAIRETWHKLNPDTDEKKQGFRRVVRFIEPEQR